MEEKEQGEVFPCYCQSFGCGGTPVSRATLFRHQKRDHIIASSNQERDDVSIEDVHVEDRWESCSVDGLT